MNVIPFRRPKFYAFCFYEGGTNVIQEWFFRCGLEETAWPAFNSILDIYETGGVDAIRAGCVELERGFWGLKIAQASGMMPCVIFKLGPFDEETEITFLAVGTWEKSRKRVRPFTTVGQAEENLEKLLSDKTRRRRA